MDGDKIYLKVVNASGEPQKLSAELKNFGDKKKAHVITLSDEDENVINEIGTNYGCKINIKPIESDVAIRDNVLETALDANSVTIFVIE